MLSNKFIAAVALSLMLSGCITFDDINKNIESKYVGQSLDRVISLIGYPSREMVVAGRKLYIWDSQNNVALVTPTTSNTQGMVAGKPVTLTTHGTQTTNFDFNCSLKLEVNDSNVVIAYDYDGNLGGCERYAK